MGRFALPKAVKTTFCPWSPKHLLCSRQQRHDLAHVYAATLLTAYRCESFEPMSHSKSRLSLIVLVNVVLNRTVVVDSD